MHCDEIGLESFADGESATKLTITILDKDGDALTDQRLTIEVVNNNDGTYNCYLHC